MKVIKQHRTIALCFYYFLMVGRKKKENKENDPTLMVSFTNNLSSQRQIYTRTISLITMQDKCMKEHEIQLSTAQYRMAG